MDVVLAQPRGFCAGVVRAIDIVERALVLHGAPVYVLHEIVHNRQVVEDLRRRGAVFLEDMEDVPQGAALVLSAHGVARSVYDAARERGLRVVDATCPLVAKVHRQALRYSRAGATVLVVGHAGHEEVRGTLGSIDGPVHLVSTAADVAALPELDGDLAYVTQTTLSVDDTREIIAALRVRFPHIVGPDVDDICYATQNRQAAVNALAENVEAVIVVGARNSSNSNRLREVVAQRGVPAWLVEDASQIDPSWFVGIARVGLTAGASAPEHLVRGVVERLRTLDALRVSEMDGITENVSFRLPEEALRALARRHARERRSA
jgi:4-hydroxy-3-methylbut-2-enyl diphosphate reductase